MMNLRDLAAHLRAVDQRPALMHLVKSEPDQGGALNGGTPDRAPDLLDHDAFPSGLVGRLDHVPYLYRASPGSRFSLAGALAGAVSPARHDLTHLLAAARRHAARAVLMTERIEGRAYHVVGV